MREWRVGKAGCRSLTLPMALPLALYTVPPPAAVARWGGWPAQGTLPSPQAPWETRQPSQRLSNSEQRAFCSSADPTPFRLLSVFLLCDFTWTALVPLPFQCCSSVSHWRPASEELVLVTLLLMLFLFLKLPDPLFLDHHTVCPRLIDLTALFCSLGVSGCHFLN